MNPEIKPSSPDQIVYLVSSRRMPLVIIGVLLASSILTPITNQLSSWGIYLSTGISTTQEFTWQELLTMVVTTLIGIYFIQVARQTKLIVSETGIIYQNIGFSVQVNWSQLNKVETKFFGRSFVEAITFQDARIKAIIHRNLFSPIRGKFIPISIFVDNWRDHPIGSVIKKHAPHII
jgi:hypothetical protein